MIERKTLSDDQALRAIEAGEYGIDVIHSHHRVAVIMTQDWCPQWASMRRWMASLDGITDLAIYELIYNKASCFSEFLEFKENRWNNRLIPYIRYYVGGSLVGESNYVTREEFLRALGL